MFFKDDDTQEKTSLFDCSKLITIFLLVSSCLALISKNILSYDRKTINNMDIFTGDSIDNPIPFLEKRWKKNTDRTLMPNNFNLYPFMLNDKEHFIIESHLPANHRLAIVFDKNNIIQQINLSGQANHFETAFLMESYTRALCLFADPAFSRQDFKQLSNLMHHPAYPQWHQQEISTAINNIYYSYHVNHEKGWSLSIKKHPQYKY